MFSIAFLIIGIHPSQPVMIISVMIMSFAELCTLPINGLLIMRAAPKHLIASYNGFTNLSLLGFSIGPVLGGYGLQFLGGQYVFLCVALLPLIIIWQYIKYVSD